jgi:hypothetical protein
MGYGNEKKDDQITGGFGKNNIKNCQSRSANLFLTFFPQGLYPASVVCHPCSAAISEGRLSRHYPDVTGFFRPSRLPGSQKGTTLFNSVLRREKAAKKRAFEKLLKAIFRRARKLGLLENKVQGAIDATGLETRYVSQYFIECSKRPSYFRRPWPKLTLVCDTRTHLIAACIVTRGPSHDCPNLPEAMSLAVRQTRFKQLLADGGFDSEFNHRFCREVLGIRSTLIGYNCRGFSRPPRGKYRRQMAEKFDKKSYGNRWQIESVISRNKRLLGSALRSRKDDSRERECLLRILSHNLMIIRRAA